MCGVGADALGRRCVECRAHVTLFVEKNNGSKSVFLLRFCGRWVCCVTAPTKIAKFDRVFFFSKKKTMGHSPCFFFFLCFFAPLGFEQFAA